jgi:nucleotide-binding universal stress UspA family protein
MANHVEKHQQYPPSGPVVAGYDGSRAAGTAIDFAAQEARLRGLPLTLVHGFTWPWIYPPLTDAFPEPVVCEPNPRVRAVHMLGEAARRLREEYPDLSVRPVVRDGHAVAVLVACSREATLVVVGHRGSGGFAELLAGSVAIQTATHAHCPVLVVRGTPTKPDAPVVVGVDGSPHTGQVLDFAFAAAARRGAPLVAVNVWAADPAWPDDLVRAIYEHRPGGDPIASGLRDCGERYPEVAVRAEAVRDRSPAHALVHAAEGASLAVVGSRGLGLLRGLLLGSVSRALIEHAPCPVAVVRPAGRAG